MNAERTVSVSLTHYELALVDYLVLSLMMAGKVEGMTEDERRQEIAALQECGKEALDVLKPAGVFLLARKLNDVIVEITKSMGKGEEQLRLM